MVVTREIVGKMGIKYFLFLLFSSFLFVVVVVCFLFFLELGPVKSP